MPGSMSVIVALARLYASSWVGVGLVVMIQTVVLGGVLSTWSVMVFFASRAAAACGPCAVCVSGDPSALAIASWSRTRCDGLACCFTWVLLPAQGGPVMTLMVLVFFPRVGVGVFPRAYWPGHVPVAGPCAALRFVGSHMSWGCVDLGLMWSMVVAPGLPHIQQMPPSRRRTYSRRLVAFLPPHFDVLMW